MDETRNTRKICGKSTQIVSTEEFLMNFIDITNKENCEMLFFQRFYDHFYDSTILTVTIASHFVKIHVKYRENWEKTSGFC